MRHKLFSYRHGFRDFNPEEILEINRKNMTPELRTRLENLIIKTLHSLKEHNFYIWEEIINHIWDAFLHKHLLFTPNLTGIIQEIEKMPWYKIYNLLEFMYISFQEHSIMGFSVFLESELNKILEEEFAPYRMIEGLIIPISDDEEIKTVKETFENLDRFHPAKEHLKKALKLLSNRESPDYVNSIKESISALESLANLILGTSGKSLTAIHQKLCSELKCPKPIEMQIKLFYDWVSKEEGIRHGKVHEKTTIGQSEAKLIFIQICGLINYLITKLSEKGIR